MACGLPVVATDVGGVREFVTDGGGLVVPPKDAVAFAAALATYLQSPESANAAGSRNRAKAASEFSWRVSAQRLLEVYRLAIQTRKESACGHAHPGTQEASATTKTQRREDTKKSTESFRRGPAMLLLQRLRPRRAEDMRIRLSRRSSEPD
jgi:hypothetical protein